MHLAFESEFAAPAPEAVVEAAEAPSFEFSPGQNVRGKYNYLPDGQGNSRYVGSTFGKVVKVRMQTCPEAEDVREQVRVAFSNGKTFWTWASGLRRVLVGTLGVGSEVEPKRAKLPDGQGNARDVEGCTGKVLEFRIRSCEGMQVTDARVEWSNGKTFWTPLSGVRKPGTGPSEAPVEMTDFDTSDEDEDDYDDYEDEDDCDDTLEGEDASEGPVVTEDEPLQEDVIEDDGEDA